MDLLRTSWKKRQSGKRSYLVKSHFAEFSPEVEQNLRELNSVVDMQFKKMVGGETAHQWTMSGDGDLDPGRGVQCCWICHRVSPKYFHWPFASIQNLSTWCPCGSPLSPLFSLTADPHSSFYTVTVFCLHDECVRSVFTLWGHFHSSEWQRTRQSLVSRWPSGYQHWTA